MGDEERVLKAGEWTDWVPVSFPLSLMQHLRGMCRFYLKQVVPHLELYVTPTNIDPLTPALPIPSPASFATDGHATGRFYTQGMPEDTKGLAAGVLDVYEFLQQARFLAGEVRKQYRHLLARFQGGFLFYYVGHVDQVSHVMWRVMDPEHPAYARQLDEPDPGRNRGVCTPTSIAWWATPWRPCPGAPRWSSCRTMALPPGAARST